MSAAPPLLLVLALVIGPLGRAVAGVSVTFPDAADPDHCRTAEGGDGRCRPIADCAEYASRADILRRPPPLCRFRGAEPLVCCASLPEVDVVGPAANDSGPSEPLLDCGRALRTIRLRRSARAAPQTALPVAQLQPIRTEVHGLIDAVPAILGKWPWMALLGTRDLSRLGRTWFCGGGLINSRYVLTAAHCVRPADAATTFVRIGEHDLQRATEVAHQERDVARVVHHPEYAASQNDLALLELAAPVQFTDAVRPVCLPPAGADHQGELADLAGWGVTEFAGDTTPTSLLEVRLRVADELECERTYERVPGFQLQFPGGLNGTKICAVDPGDGNQDACSGDSGGPLVWPDPETGRYQLIGVVATGVGCGNPDFPGIYTKVSAYIDWIASVAF